MPVVTASNQATRLLIALNHVLPKASNAELAAKPDILPATVLPKDLIPAVVAVKRAIAPLIAVKSESLHATTVIKRDTRLANAPSRVTQRR